MMTITTVWRLTSAVAAGMLMTLGLSTPPVASVSPTTTSTASQHHLCKPGLVPIKTAKGHRCVRLTLPKVASASQYIERAAAVDP
jgi:hypothetical protein